MTKNLFRRFPHSVSPGLNTICCLEFLPFNQSQFVPALHVCPSLPAEDPSVDSAVTTPLPRLFNMDTLVHHRVRHKWYWRAVFESWGPPNKLHPIVLRCVRCKYRTGMTFAVGARGCPKSPILCTDFGFVSSFTTLPQRQPSTPRYR